MSGADHPSEPAGSYLEADGIRTFCIDRGSGAPVVLLHGSSPAIDAYATWYPTIERLEHRYRVIAFDQVGFGRTAIDPDGRFRNRLERTPHAIAMLDQLGVRGATLVGHSEGGFVVARIAIERPDLVSRLVIVTSGGSSPALGGSADEAWMRASAAAYDYAAQVVDEEAFIASLRHLCLTEDPRLDAVMRANYRRARESGNLDLFLRLAASATDPRRYAELQEQHLFPHLKRIDVPVLLIWADEDATVPVARGLALMRMLPRADMHVFSHARHMVMHDRAEDFAEMIGSWAGRARGGA